MGGNFNNRLLFTLVFLEVSEEGGKTLMEGDKVVTEGSHQSTH